MQLGSAWQFISKQPTTEVYKLLSYGGIGGGGLMVGSGSSATLVAINRTISGNQAINSGAGNGAVNTDTVTVTVNQDTVNSNNSNDSGSGAESPLLLLLVGVWLWYRRKLNLSQ